MFQNMTPSYANAVNSQRECVADGDDQVKFAYLEDKSCTLVKLMIWIKKWFSFLCDKRHFDSYKVTLKVT